MKDGAPLFARATDLCTAIAGGAEAAARKIRRGPKSGAARLPAAPDLVPERAGPDAPGRAEPHGRSKRVATVRRIATDQPAWEAQFQAFAESFASAVQSGGRPARCFRTTPAFGDRGPKGMAGPVAASVAVSQIRARIAQRLAVAIGCCATLAGSLRRRGTKTGPLARHPGFPAYGVAGCARAEVRRDAEWGPAGIFNGTIADQQRPPARGPGGIVFVGAGPGARDLLTLRAVERLQAADIIFYDRLVDPAVLELARPDAERRYVGKHVGAHHWPQDRISAAIVAEARNGRRVVRLKSGDPGIFGRLTEELDAAAAQGVPVEIVPGVTAACAAAAQARLSLTSRGATDTLVLTTGAAQDGGNAPACLRHASPGTTTAFYMAVREAARVSAGLMAHGLPGKSEVLVAHGVETSSARLVTCTIRDLPGTLAREGIKGVTTILVSWPRDAVPAAVVPGKPCDARQDAGRNDHAMGVPFNFAGDRAHAT